MLEKKTYLSNKQGLNELNLRMESRRKKRKKVIEVNNKDRLKKKLIYLNRGIRRMANLYEITATPTSNTQVTSNSAVIKKIPKILNDDIYGFLASYIITFIFLVSLIYKKFISRRKKQYEENVVLEKVE